MDSPDGWSIGAIAAAVVLLLGALVPHYLNFRKQKFTEEEATDERAIKRLNEIIERYKENEIRRERIIEDLNKENKSLLKELQELTAKHASCRERLIMYEDQLQIKPEHRWRYDGWDNSSDNHIDAVSP